MIYRLKTSKRFEKAHDAQIPVIALLPDDATDYPECINCQPSKPRPNLLATW